MPLQLQPAASLQYCLGLSFIFPPLLGFGFRLCEPHGSLFAIDGAVGQVGGKDERAAGEVEGITEVFAATELTMEDVVESDVWEPMWRTDGQAWTG